MMEALFINDAAQFACFGRMTLELPKGAYLQASLYRYPGANKNIETKSSISQDDHLMAMKKFEDILRNTKHEKHTSLLQDMRNVPGKPDARIFIHWEHDFSESIVSLTGFARSINNTQYKFVSDASPLLLDSATRKMANALIGLRDRSDGEIPQEHGFCLDNAFIKDELKGEGLERAEISFKLEPWVGTYISVQTFVNQVKEPASLLQRLADAQSRPGFGQKHSLIRSGRRSIGNFDGEEVLALNTEQHRRYFHFVWEVEGQLHRNDPPDIKLELHVAQDGKPGEMTQEQALALWEYLLPRLKLRAVTAKPPTASVTGERTPLGTLQASGRSCPQTGWWECDDPLPLAQASSGVWLEEGQRMPMARVWLRPSWWQQWKDERSVGERAAVWRLAAYEAPGPAPSPSRK